MNRPTRNTLFGCVLCLVLAGFWSCAAKAQDGQSANHVMAGCRNYLAARFSVDTALPIGVCIGEVTAIADISPKVCPPSKSTNDQAIRIVVLYIDQHPDRMHLPFSLLAEEGLVRAWRCKK